MLSAKSMAIFIQAKFFCLRGIDKFVRTRPYLTLPKDEHLHRSLPKCMPPDANFKWSEQLILSSKNTWIPMWALVYKLSRPVSNRLKPILRKALTPLALSAFSQDADKL